MIGYIRRTVNQVLQGVEDRYIVIGAVIISTFFIGFGGGIVFPILPNLGIILGISPFFVGVILSANRFSRLVANAPAGSLVDRIGTRTPFVVGMLIQAVASFGYVIAVVAPVPEAWFLLARLLWGVGSALVFATAYTIASDVSDSGSRGTSMGLIRGGVLFGAPTGLVVGGIVSEVAGTIVAFSLATLFAFVATFIAYASIPETHVEDGARRSVKPWDVDMSVPAVTVGVINFAVLFVYFGVLFSTLVLFLADNDLGLFGFQAQGTSGLFMALTVIAAGVFMFIGGYISDLQKSRVPTLVGFLGIMFVGFVLLAYAESISMLAVACLCIGTGQGGTSGPLMALLGDLTASERMGRAVGTNNVLGDVGGGFGPIIALPLVDLIGFRPVFLGSAVLPLVGAIVLLAGVHRETGQFLPAVEMTDL